MMARTRVSRPDTAAARASLSDGRLPTKWICILLGSAVLLAYLPALRGGFIWDDNGHVTRTDLQSVGGLFRIWFEVGATQQYYPLLHSVFWLEHRLWGDAPLGYHVANVCLHLVAACLFAGVLRRLAVPGAWFAAVLFVLHPVCVESVAWISEQKNTLSAVFYLLAARAYLDFDHDRGAARYIAATVLFACALLTKTVTATLPAALLVVFWWQRGRLDHRRDVVPLLPWFALGAASGLFTAHVERVLIGAQGADFTLGFAERCLLAGRVFWFYLGKLAWPADLVFVYPRWVIDTKAAWQWLFTAAALALLGGFFAWRGRSRAPLAAALLFGGTLFPVLGFLDIYPFIFSYVADHFQYLASLAVFATSGAGLWQLTSAWPVAGRWAVRAGLPVLLGILTFGQSRMYRDEKTVFEATLVRNPDCWLAHHNLAVIYANEGRVAEAIPLLEKVLQLRPDYALAENSLGDDLTRLGRPQEAIPHFERAVRLEPRYYQAFNNLGYALMAVGRVSESVAHFESALRLHPDFPEAEHNLGQALLQLSRTPEALPHFERALRLRPDYAEAELSLGIALTMTSGFNSARPHYEKAVALAPENPEIPGIYARALLQAGRYDDAAAQLQTVVRLLPDNAEAHLDLARVLRQLGRLPEATDHYRTALRLNPTLGNRP